MVWRSLLARWQLESNPEKPPAADGQTGLLHLAGQGLNEAKPDAQPLPGSLCSLHHAIAEEEADTAAMRANPEQDVLLAMLQGVGQKIEQNLFESARSA